MGSLKEDLQFLSQVLILRADSFIESLRYGDSAGPLATIHREPGQARKGAATAVDSCAGMWLVELPPSTFH